MISGAGEEALEQLCHGATAAGIEGAGGNFIEGNENKGTFSKTRVRDDKTRTAEDKVGKEEKVEVEGTGPVGKVEDAASAEVLFREEEGAEEFERSQAGLESEDGVHETRLAGVSDRGRGVERRAGNDTPDVLQALGRGSQCGLGRADGTGQVRAHSDKRSAHTVQGTAMGCGWRGPGRETARNLLASLLEISQNGCIEQRGARIPPQ